MKLTKGQKENLIFDLKNLFDNYGLYIVSEDPYCSIELEAIEGNEKNYSDNMKNLEKKLNETT